MQKIFDSYGQRKGIPPESIRFLLEDKRIRGDSTPKMLELEDGDQIDAMYVSTYIESISMIVTSQRKIYL